MLAFSIGSSEAFGSSDWRRYSGQLGIHICTASENTPQTKHPSSFVAFHSLLPCSRVASSELPHCCWVWRARLVVRLSVSSPLRALALQFARRPFVRTHAHANRLRSAVVVAAVFKPGKQRTPPPPPLTSQNACRRWYSVSWFSRTQPP